MAIPTVLSICTGYGGIELGLSAVGDFEPVCYVESDLSQASILAARIQEGLLPDAPIWSDLKTFNGRAWGGVVDILTGGFPCQPWSTAGKKLGEDDPSHLCPDVERVIRELKYRVIFLENVPGILESYYYIIRPELQAMGYTVTEGLFTAEETGAPHRRQRLFILGVHGGNAPSFMAHPSAERLQRWLAWDDSLEEQQISEGLRFDRGNIPSDIGHSLNDMAQLPNPQHVRPYITTDTGGNGETIYRSQKRENSPIQSEGVHPTGDAHTGVEDTISERQQRRSRGLVEREVSETGGTSDITKPSGSELGNPSRERLQGIRLTGETEPSERPTVIPLYPPGPSDWEGWAYMLSEMPEALPHFCILGDGTPSQVEQQLRSYGNGVVPAVAAIAWCHLIKTFI